MNRIQKETEGFLNRWRGFVRQTIRRGRWLLPTVNFLVGSPVQSKKRILAIWDFRTAPYSIGDLIILHEKTQLLRLTHKVDKVDICFLCSPTHPVRKRDAQGVTSDNFHYHFPALVSTVFLNPHIGSFFLFDSATQLERFVTDNAARYYIWPNVGDYASRHKAYEENFDSIQQFYRKKGFIPYLDCRPSTLEWAYAFYKRYIFPDDPVVVHLRNTPFSSPKRNARLDAWIEFFKACEGKFDVRFVLIGAAREIDNRLRRLANLLIAQDYHTSAEKDLVLGYSALIFMGNNSGPAVMVNFSQTPYLVFNYWPANATVPGGKNFNFATDLQKLIWEPETAKMLMEEFTHLFQRVNKTAWREKMGEFMAGRGQKTFQTDLLWAD